MNQRDIAKIAGVSSATVSRVINNDPSVTDQTQARVKEAIEKYGYIPNVVARNLKKANTKTIGFLEPEISNPCFPLLIEGIEKVCWQKKYDIIFENTNEDEQKEASAIETLFRLRVDGMAGYFVNPTSELVNSINKRGVPLVLIDRKIVEGENVNDYVIVDNIDGMYLMVNYLAKLGHRKIALIHGTVRDTPGLERVVGFHKAMEKNGIQINKDYIAQGKFSRSHGYKSAQMLMHLPDPPTAIITANNFLTMGAYKGLIDMNVQIPQEVSLAGFDDFVLADALSPKITCVTRDIVRMGEIAAEMLFDRIERPNDVIPMREVVLPVQLIIRDSCVPPLRK